MESALLQELVALSGQDGVSTITQSAHQYFDIGQNEDLVFYLDVRFVQGNVSLAYDTSPTPQDSSFLPMVAPIAINALSPAPPTLVVSRATFATAAVPPARYVRWRLSTTGGAWAVTFRVWVALYGYR